MNYPVKGILLNDQFERYTLKPSQPAGTKCLTNLSKINVFVGENNSGKSKFLRHLAAIEKLQFAPELPNGRSWAGVAQIHTSFVDNCKRAFQAQGVTEADGFVQRLNSLPKFDFLEENSSAIQQISQLAQSLLGLREFQSVTHGMQNLYQQNVLLMHLKQFAETWSENIRQAPDIKAGSLTFAKIYIPTLRGLRTLTTDKDIYHEKTTTDYFGKGPCPEIYTGQMLYDNVKRLLLGTRRDRNNIRAFENFISESFFENRPVALIPRLEPPVLHIKIAGEVEREVHLLGDGIQSIIILTFPIFANPDKPVLLFCEEPELYLHPGLQRVLLSVLMRFPNHQYFLTTHSNHFLDLTLDFKSVSVFTFQKQFDAAQGDEQEPRFEVENINNENRRSLELLGVRNSSVFLSNCTIWVEGITDRRYFQHYLDLYQRADTKRRQFVEDLHYSFVEYGGACITHWSFLDSESDAIDVTRLCGKLFLIADGDTRSQWKEVRHKRLAESLNERYCQLQCKEVENLLSPDVIRDVLTGYGETEMQDFEQDEYKDEPLGSYIDTVVLAGKRNRKASYAEDGTLRNKVAFCEKAVGAIKNFRDLSPEARSIAERLYEFIAANNK